MRAKIALVAVARDRVSQHKWDSAQGFRLWASVQSTTGSRGVHISRSNAGYSMFRGSAKSTGYPLHSPVSLSLPFPASPCAITFQLHSDAGYTMFRGSVKSFGYPLHSPVSPSLPLPCVTVCHHILTGLQYLLLSHTNNGCTNEPQFYVICAFPVLF